MTRKLYELFCNSGMTSEGAGRCTVFLGMAAGWAVGWTCACLPVLQEHLVTLASGGLLAGFAVTGFGLLNTRR